MKSFLKRPGAGFPVTEPAGVNFVPYLIAPIGGIFCFIQPWSDR